MPAKILGKHKFRVLYLVKRVLLMLLLPAIIGVPHAIYEGFRHKTWRSYTKCIAFMLCIAIYLGGINATKRPGGDQWQYYKAYTNVPQIGFVNSLTWIYGLDYGRVEHSHISGEFMNGVYNYFGYYFTGGYYPLFVFLYTIIEYMLVYIGFYRFCQTLKKPRIPFVCGILILSFFYLYFQYIFQIQKQFLAQAIMMFVLGTYAATGKMTKGLWATAVVAVFTHASTGLFLPFLAYKPLYAKINKIGLLLLTVTFAGTIYFGPEMASAIVSSDAGITGYGVSKLANSIERRETNALVLSQVIVIAIPLALIVFKKLIVDRKKEIDKAHRFIFSIIVFLLVTIIAMFRQFTAQYRFFMMLLAFMPFAYPFIFRKIRHRDKTLIVLAAIMIVWFYFQFEFIPWHYADEWEIILKSPLILLIQGWELPQ